MEREQEGRVTLDCIVDGDGRISCTVVSEDPTGWGFGEAAMRISRNFRAAAQTSDGRPTSGGRTRVPITFRLAANRKQLEPKLKPRRYKRRGFSHL